MDCWFRAKSDSSFSPASVKYLEKCSQLRLLAGKSSCGAEIIFRLKLIQIQILTHQLQNLMIMFFIANKKDTGIAGWKTTFSPSVQKGSNSTVVRTAEYFSSRLQFITVHFTISLLSMPTLRRLPATELMSLSLIHDLNSLTAKAADTPEQR